MVAQHTKTFSEADFTIVRLETLENGGIEIISDVPTNEGIFDVRIIIKDNKQQSRFRIVEDWKLTNKMKKFCITTSTVLFFLLACKDEENNFNPLETGFVSHLSFNGNLNDDSNYAAVLDSCASSSYVPGVHGEALMLDENCRIASFDKMTFRNSQRISVSVWFKTSENGSTWHFIKSSDFAVFTAYSTAGIAISIPETNSAKGAFELDKWTHLVGTYDGTTIKTYINGNLAASTKHKGEISEPGYSFELNGGDHWTGAVDELYIFDTVLNEEQVKKLYTM